MNCKIIQYVSYSIIWNVLAYELDNLGIDYIERRQPAPKYNLCWSG